MNDNNNKHNWREEKNDGKSIKHTKGRHKNNNEKRKCIEEKKIGNKSKGISDGTRKPLTLICQKKKRTTTKTKANNNKRKKKLKQ